MMQSYLEIFLLFILTLEIGYFLLCIVSQFRVLNVVVVLASFINLALLFLLHQYFKFKILSGPLHFSVLGFCLFSLIGASIIGLDENNILAKRKIVFKLPFVGMAIGFYLDPNHALLLFLLTLLALFYFLYHERERFRLYFRQYFFFLTSLILAFLCQDNKLALFIFSFSSIMYLNGLLNFMLVKTKVRELLC